MRELFGVPFAGCIVVDAACRRDVECVPAQLLESGHAKRVDRRLEMASREKGPLPCANRNKVLAPSVVNPRKFGPRISMQVSTPA